MAFSFGLSFAVLILLFNVLEASRLHHSQSYFRRHNYSDTSWLRESPHRHFDFPSAGIASQDVSSSGPCAASGAKAIKAPKTNIWDELTTLEKKSVKKLLKQEFKKQKIDNSHIYNVELLPPNKTNALSYLDGNGAPPTRYAQCFIYFASAPDPHYQYLLVGPLPVNSKTTKVTPLEYPYSKESKGRIRSLEQLYAYLYSHWFPIAGRSVEKMTMDLWGGVAVGRRNRTLFIDSITPLWQDDGLVSWQGFQSEDRGSRFDIGTLLPLGLYFGVNMTNKDYKSWNIIGWMYNGEFFSTAKALQDAYFSGKLPRLPAVNPKGSWAETDQRGPKPPLDHLYPPTHIAPGGSRFFLDKNAKYVKWMDFEFYFIDLTDRGLRLFDVKFKGKRIIYEVGMEEAMAHYAANDPLMSGTTYLDSIDGFNGGRLVYGYDCPSYATYFSKSICMFEMDAGYPMSRHDGYSYISITKNIFFTLRKVSTVGNYDYEMNYEFYMDGSIRINARAAGYFEGTYFAKNEDYGYTVHKGLSGGMHDHVFNFKVDFDIDGVANSLQKVQNVPVSQIYPWSNGKPRHTMKLEKSFITSEDDSKLMWGDNSATQYIIVNQDAKNAYGELPGYRIVPENAIHLTPVPSSNLGKSAEWATHNLFVTQRKDTEQRSGDPWSTEDINKPLINFNDYFNGESLEQTDLVAWINMGMHHTPNTGDLPMTVYTTAHSSVHLQPINYFPGSPVVNTVNMVRLNEVGNSGKKFKVTNFGADQGMCSIEYSSQSNILVPAGECFTGNCHDVV